jgi:hypothetical protein
VKPRRRLPGERLDELRAGRPGSELVNVVEDQDQVAVEPLADVAAELRGDGADARWVVLARLE